MRLGRGNEKVSCAIIEGIWLWGCCWKGTLTTRLLTIGGFVLELSRKLAKISAKGWRSLVSKGSALEDDSIGKIGLVSTKSNSTSSLISFFRLTNSCRRNIPYSSCCLPLQCMQLNWWLVNQAYNFVVSS